VNTRLNMTVHHLLAVYSGGKIDLSGAGFRPNSGMEGPGAGIGKTWCLLVVSSIVLMLLS